jgi:phospholipid-transporting ATPase
MIQGAHIGIGIRGKEGSASVQASDVAISQFRFLANLLLCHGRKAYRRMATFLCFFIYRSVALGWSYALYAADTSFSGKLAFPEWLDMTYSPLTTVAVVVLLVLDSDYDDEMAVKSPMVYSPGPARLYLNAWVFGKWMLCATLHGILAWVVPVYLLTTHEDRLAQTHSFWQASYTAFTIMVIIVHLKLIIMAVKPMHNWAITAILLEMILYVPMSLFLGSSFGAKHLSPELQNVPTEVVSSWPHLSCLVLVPLAAVAIDFLEERLSQRLPELIHAASSKHKQPCVDQQ